MDINDLLNGKLIGDLNLKLEIEQKETEVTTEMAIHKMALDVIDGMYGSGTARKDNIYKTVQNEVNEILKGA